MADARWLPILPLSTALLLGACVADPPGSDPVSSSADTVVQMQRLRPSGATATDRTSAAEPAGAMASPAPLVGSPTNFGGPVLAHVSVHPVYWNASTQFQSNLNAFYKAIPNSTYFDLLSSYGVFRGSGVNGVVDNRSTTTVSDAVVRTELNRLFSAAIIPLPNANNYYPVHFPAGMTITAPDGSRSCVAFCGYHGTYVRAGVNVNYGVIPDQGGDCAGACGNNLALVNNLDAIASAQLVNAVTDPALGLATVFGPPLAWYDPNIGEIVNFCGQQTAVVGGDGVIYVVEKFISIVTHQCVP
jgi:hypothetical protein